MHVGEDFVHLLSGLRIVEEAVRHFDLREGDRLGHAVALGIDALEWARRTGRVAMCREDRLLDLLWELSWGSTFGRYLVRGRHFYLDREITRLSRAIFRTLYSPFELLELVEQLYNPKDLANAGFPGGFADSDQSVPLSYKLLYQYLTDPAVYQRGQTVEWVDVGAEGELLAELQAGVRREVGRRGITVEVNPSSNLLVGDLSDLTRHPLWRLFPPRPSAEVPPVGICFGSDDPITFATAIREEYQLVSDALISAGLSEQEARHWTDQVRRNGLEARFTVWQP